MFGGIRSAGSVATVLSIEADAPDTNHATWLEPNKLDFRIPVTPCGRQLLNVTSQGFVHSQRHDQRELVMYTHTHTFRHNTCISVSWRPCIVLSRVLRSWVRAREKRQHNLAAWFLSSRLPTVLQGLSKKENKATNWTTAAGKMSTRSLATPCLTFLRQHVMTTKGSLLQATTTTSTTNGSTLKVWSEVARRRQARVLPTTSRT
jgi:hypothetical protein